MASILCICLFSNTSFSRDAGVGLTSYLVAEDRKFPPDDSLKPYLNSIIDSSLHHPDRPMNVIELGCGCGIVGMGVAEKYGKSCQVVLTDLEAAQEIACKNIGWRAIETPNLSFEVVDWDEELPDNVRDKHFDLCLVADCTYNPDVVPSLVQTLVGLSKVNRKLVTVLAMKVRHESEAVFFDMMKGAGFLQKHHTSLPIGESQGLDFDEVKVIDIYAFEMS
jgi:Lysine methyltransferase